MIKSLEKLRLILKDNKLRLFEEYNKAEHRKLINKKLLLRWLSYNNRYYKEN